MEIKNGIKIKCKNFDSMRYKSEQKMKENKLIEGKRSLGNIMKDINNETKNNVYLKSIDKIKDEH